MPRPSTVINQVLSSFSPPLPFPNSYNLFSLSQFIVDLDIKVPRYISDEPTIWFLAKVAVGLDEQATVAGEDVTAMEEDDAEVKIISKKEAITKTPCKRRAKKMKTPLDDKFLCRSKRLNQDLGGFRT